MYKFLRRNYATKSAKKRKKFEERLELLKPPKKLPFLSTKQNLLILDGIKDVTFKPDFGE
jgi:hypothetical protein